VFCWRRTVVDVEFEFGVIASAGIGAWSIHKRITESVAHGGRRLVPMKES
jgi:hypothetical protein